MTTLTHSSSFESVTFFPHCLQGYPHVISNSILGSKNQSAGMASATLLILALPLQELLSVLSLTWISSK